MDIGADVNWINADGDTPLLAAARRGHATTVGLLLVHGADINAIGADTYSALHIACKRGDISTVTLLLDSNSNVSLRTSDGLTARDIAVSYKHMDIINRLDNNQQMLMQQHEAITQSPTATAVKQHGECGVLINADDGNIDGGGGNIGLYGVKYNVDGG